MAAISTVSADEFTTRLLWVGAPTATLSGLVAVAGGAAGLGLLGLVVLLIWASNRRPLLDPSYLELTSPRTDIYPETLVIGDRRYHLLHFYIFRICRFPLQVTVSQSSRCTARPRCRT